MDEARHDVQKAVVSREQLYKWLQDTFASDTAPAKAGSYELLPSEKALRMLAVGLIVEEMSLSVLTCIRPGSTRPLSLSSR